MLNSNGFDLWADGYDKSVHLSEESDTYPFAGYKNVLSMIYRTVRNKGKASVLDIGFGTGVLTKKLYDSGCAVCGIDFSEKMIEIAKAKMPNAVLFQHDFTKGLPQELAQKQFDFILCTYAIHHLTDAQQVNFLSILQNHLYPDGKIVLGDVAFETEAQLEACRKASGADWDSEEFYMVFENLKKHFIEAEFEKISFCAGVVTISK